MATAPGAGVPAVAAGAAAGVVEAFELLFELLLLLPQPAAMTSTGARAITTNLRIDDLLEKAIPALTDAATGGFLPGRLAPAR
jgi:hypothetical protein